VKLPHLSIATKLYAILALLATVTVGLAAVAVVNAGRHATLTEQFGAAFKGGQNIEQINGLIYALVMETRAIYLAEDAGIAQDHAKAIVKFSERLSDALKGWQQSLQSEDGDRFREMLLSRGGSADALDLFKNFVGRDPYIEPLLKRRGLDRPPGADDSKVESQTPRR